MQENILAFNCKAFFLTQIWFVLYTEKNDKRYPQLAGQVNPRLPFLGCTAFNLIHSFFPFFLLLFLFLFPSKIHVVNTACSNGGNLFQSWTIVRLRVHRWLGRPLYARGDWKCSFWFFASHIYISCAISRLFAKKST